MKIRARWAGPSPRVGDYLMSSSRPRLAYHVLEVERVGSNVRWDPGLKTEYRLLEITVGRLPAHTVPVGARVHPWRWDRRGPSRPTPGTSKHPRRERP